MKFTSSSMHIHIHRRHHHETKKAALLMMAIKKKKDSERKRRRRKKKRVIGSFVLLEKIGDCEKAAAMKRWYTYRPILILDFKLESGGYVASDQGKVKKIC